MRIPPPDPPVDTITSVTIDRGGIKFKFETNVWYRTRIATDLLVLSFTLIGSVLYASGTDDDGRALELPATWLKIPSPLEQLARAGKQKH